MKTTKRFLVILLCCVFCFCIGIANIKAETKHSTQSIIECANKIVTWQKSQLGINNTDNLLSGEFLNNAGTTQSDWYVIAMKSLGNSDDYQSYGKALSDYVSDCYQTDEKLSSSKSTEWHRISLAMLASGNDPENVSINGENKINLIADGVYNRNNLGKQGLNGWIWGLIALDSNNFLVSKNAVYSRENIIEEILSAQLSSGGFAISGNKDDVDITAMAVTALSNYYESEKTFKLQNGKEITVKAAIDNALKFLSISQQSNGDFAVENQANSDSTAQVLIALCSMNIDFNSDNRFIKNGTTVLDALLTYQNSDGGFCHTKNADNVKSKSDVQQSSDTMSSQQALCALASVKLQQQNKRLYDFSDNNFYVSTETSAQSNEQNLYIIFYAIGISIIAFSVIRYIVAVKRKK